MYIFSKRTTAAMLLISATFALSACSETTSGGSGASLQPAGSISSGASMRTASASDEQACLTAVESQTGNSVMVLSSETSEANNLVMIGVGPQQAPWRCLISGGTVVEVMSMTNEGAL